MTILPMSLSKAQRGVAAGMAAGVVATLVVLALVAATSAWGVEQNNLPDRLVLLASVLILPAVALAIAIARLAKHRFFTPQDIDGSALTTGTDRARLLQALLQNTLEQLGLAVPVYIGWALLAPVSLLPTLAAAAILFLLGRLLFFASYARGAAARAFGFSLTFYPTMVLLLALIAVGVQAAFR